MNDTETFNRFRRKLEDLVTVAINSNKKVSASNQDCYCPMGCHPDSNHRRTGFWNASDIFGISRDAAQAFGQAFDCGVTGSYYTPYAELGRLYRARFP